MADATVNTAKIKDRRTLRFESVDEAIREAETLVAAEQAGTLRKVGNWSLGEAISHVAYWANAPFDGYPAELKVPWLMKFLMGFLRGRILTKGMMPGVKISGAPGGTYGAEKIPAGEAFERLRSAFTRIDQTCPPDPNPLFGDLTHTQWKQLNLRHAELHFGFYFAE